MPQEKNRIAFINAKMNNGQGKKGTELAPQLIKQEFLYTNLYNLNYEATDYAEYSDVPVEEETIFLKNKNILSLGKTTYNICNAVCSAIEEGCTPVILGGDHSLAIGSVHGTAKAMAKQSSEIGLLWIDAHADINTPLTTLTGNIHGQCISFFVHELDEYVPKLRGFEWVKSCIPAKNLVYIGLRDLDPLETILIKKLNIKAFCMSDIQRLGIHQVMKEVVEYLTRDNELLPLHVSCDIDVLDPWFAPCTGTPVLGGLNLPELMYIGNFLHETGKIKTLDLVEVNPMLKSNDSELDRTIFCAIRTVLSFFGYKTMGTLMPVYNIPKP